MEEQQDQNIRAVAASTGSSRKKREEKSRRRDPRAWENVMKLLVNVPEAEKIEFISEKYIELHNELRKVTQNFQNIERQFSALQREKDHAQSEQAKCILAKARLENLCRELQKQNKQIKEENLTKIKEEEDRRKEIASKFSEKVNDITSMMEESRDKSTQLRDENMKMSAKLALLYEHFKDKEDSFAKMSKQLELQKQLANATIAKMEYELKAEKEIWNKERDTLQANLIKSENNCQLLQENVRTLQEHINLYKNQYADFETTMTKSNDIFKNFKSEMSKMSKQIIAVDKEANTWKEKWQGNANSLIQLSELHQVQESELRAAEKKIEMLQKLCRQLQLDRASFLKLLKSNGIEVTPQASLEDTEKTTSYSAPISKKPTKKEQELEILRNSLKVLQTQLTETAQTTISKQDQRIEDVALLSNCSEKDPIPSTTSDTNGIFSMKPTGTDCLVQSIDTSNLIGTYEQGIVKNNENVSESPQISNNQVAEITEEIVSCTFKTDELCDSTN